MIEINHRLLMFLKNSNLAAPAASDYILEMTAERGRRISYLQACERLGIFNDASDKSISNVDENKDISSHEAEMDVREAGDVASFEEQEDFEDIFVFEEGTEER